MTSKICSFPSRIIELPKRIDLSVPFEEKDEAKQFYVEWDDEKRVWWSTAVPPPPQSCVFALRTERHRLGTAAV
ncbi:DUF5710 domain-containing protein [Pseudomonas sp. R1-1]|uniref:DUF5710 domain-containing protein n=1 Tax=Pseudomonas sp. R1-1 TaxID=1602529 RepID=UPI003DA825BC